MRVTPAPAVIPPGTPGPEVLLSAQIPPSIDDEDTLSLCLRIRVAVDQEIKYLEKMKKDLNARLGDWVDEHGAVDVPSGMPGRVIRLKKVAGTRTTIDADGLWAALPARNRRGLFKTTHTIVTEELEQRLDRDAALKDLVRQFMTTTVNAAAVRVDLVEIKEDDQ